MDERFEVHLITGEVLTGIADGMDKDRLFLRSLEVEGQASKEGTTAVVLLSAVAWWRILA